MFFSLFFFSLLVFFCFISTYFFAGVSHNLFDSLPCTLPGAFFCFHDCIRLDCCCRFFSSLHCFNIVRTASVLSSLLLFLVVVKLISGVIHSLLTATHSLSTRQTLYGLFFVKRLLSTHQNEKSASSNERTTTRTEKKSICELNEPFMRLSLSLSLTLNFHSLFLSRKHELRYKIKSYIHSLSIHFQNAFGPN